MQLTILREKQGFDTVERFDEFEALFQSQPKTGGGEGVRIGGGGAENGDAGKSIGKGISVGRIQKMVIEHTVLFEAALVDAGGHQRAVRDGSHGDGIAAV